MVFIVLGLYQPNLQLLEQQLRSLSAQTYTSFQVLLACDGPLTAEAQEVLNAVQDDRFFQLPFEDNVGVHANFARGLQSALTRSPREDDLFAFCDQDDVWHPDKLARQVDLMTRHPECGLCHCDARVIDELGNEVATSVFAYEARSKRQGLLDLLVMNSVTGMTCLARKPIAQSAAGFPMSGTREMLHDHWVALVAAAQSRVVFLDHVLVDYVQHSANALGARSPSNQTVVVRNVLFAGRKYWARCKRQFVWRSTAVEALEAVPGASEALRKADIRGMAGAARLLNHMISRWFSGEHRQAAQAWRLLAGKFF